ncbi:MAG: membrane lipoprotein lipid attachment site-containing protein [bacterium]|nr:membrane lipoprotein lipid attachment site-containing protein [bacterium]
MKKFLFFFVLTAVTAGCSNPINKSITEYLSVKEIKSISKKDPLFLAFYDRYFENNCYEHFLADKTVRVMYSDITYKRYYEYIKQINDDDFIDAIYEEAEKEWNEKFDNVDQRFDSIINFWQNYLQENAPNTYLHVEFDHADTYYTYSQKGIKLYFKLTPQKGRLRSASFWYSIRTRGDDNSVLSGRAYQIQPFSNPVMLEDRPSFVDTQNAFYKDVVMNRMSVEELKEKYSFGFSIDDVRTDEGIYINMDKLCQEMPADIRMYLKELSGDFGSGADIENIMNNDKDSIIKHYIDKDYISLDEYKITLQNIRMEEIDPMCYNFQRFIVNCKKAL